jgi:uncharacterized protein (TIGR04376 family)
MGMGIFEDFSNFLETRLEEFLRNNPHLELQALEEKLREQEDEAIRLIADLRRREKQLEAEILETAQEIQRWHIRIDKAKKAQRFDLAQPAEEREAALLRQGNQLWGQMEMLKTRIQQTGELQKQIQQRKQEVKVKVAEAQAARVSAEQQQQTSAWNNTRYPSTFSSPSDPLEQTFRRWETDAELDELKRQMGR